MDLKLVEQWRRMEMDDLTMKERGAGKEERKERN